MREELGTARAARLRRALNATGVIVHTNLGRAPLSEAALERVHEVGRGYSNLEYDLSAGARGSRQDHVAGVLRRLTGAEAALVVNNNAAAVLLALAALAEGREVVVSRGELIEIGDGFRIPDVLARSGARLVEVGTTNRTRAADYDRAVGPETAVLLRVHQSNFRLVGFTELPSVAELAKVAQRHGLPLVDDLGSGALARVEDEPSVRESLEAGADLVCFSGDKLLGGPQAGIVVGRAELVEQLRRHPLQRAVRATSSRSRRSRGRLALYLDPEAGGCRGAGAANGHRGARRRAGARRAARQSDRRRGRGDRGAHRRRSAPTRGAAELRVRDRRGAGGAAAPGRAAGDRRRPRRAAAPGLPDAERRRGGRGRRRRHGRSLMGARAPESQLWELLRGALATRALAIVAELGVPDALAAGPRAVEELAREVGADADTLHRLLRALASDGVFAEEEPGIFRNTDASEQLRHSGWSAFAHLFGGAFYQAVGGLDASGKAAFPELYDTDFWSWLAEHPDERSVFDTAMEQGKQQRVERFDRVDWRGDETVVDVGGGNGSLLVELLPRQPGLRGIVFDLPETVRDEEALGDRIEFVEGSFFESVPEGDVYVLSTILHDWDDERAAAILRTIREAASPDARLILLEAVVPTGNEPGGAKWLDLLMLALFAGRERNEAQWRALLEAGGFEPTSIEDGLIQARCR